jgi:hypothetical protein
MNLLSLFDVLPNPWNRQFTNGAVILMVLGIVLIAQKNGASAWWPGAVALVAACLVLAGFNSVNRAETSQNGTRGGRYKFIWFSGGLLLALGTLVLRGDALPGEWLFVALPFFLAALYSALQSKRRTAAMWLFPLLLSASILGVGAFMGTLGAAAFPAVFGLFLGLILQSLRELERRITTSVTEDAATHKLVHRRLSWVSVIFFVFGVISLWPWLGRLFGTAYLWILIIGVLFPVMTLWGRLRQPRRDNMLTALVRFNRVLPYASLVLMLAFVLG